MLSRGRLSSALPSVNRTCVELKYGNNKDNEPLVYSVNRTCVELK